MPVLRDRRRVVVVSGYQPGSMFDNL